MSDLISRSNLIKHFETIQQQEKAIGLDFVAIIDEIKEQPTAYDIDKVVEELEKQAEQYRRRGIDAESRGALFQHSAYNFYGKARSYEYAIEIVKAGGSNDRD